MKAVAAFACILFVLVFTVHAQELTHSSDSVEAVKKAVIDGKAVLLDVREQGEWDAGHVKGAVFIPKSDIVKDAQKAAATLPKDKPVYVHCRSGKRALDAGTLLKAQGIDVRPLKFTAEDFQKAGLELEKK